MLLSKGLKQNKLMATENLNTTFLVQQMQLGSEQAFTQVYDYFSTPLYRNIFRMVKDEDITEELLQDLFLKLWTKRGDLDHHKPLKPYLYKMAASLVYNYFRKVAQDKRLVDQLILTTVDHISSVEEEIVGKEALDLLKEAIDRLPSQRRLVFTLCKLEGYTYKEVSERLGISGATINEHIVKANRAIKDFFLTHQDVALMLFTTSLINADLVIYNVFQ